MKSVPLYLLCSSMLTSSGLSVIADLPSPRLVLVVVLVVRRTAATTRRCGRGGGRGRRRGRGDRLVVLLDPFEGVRLVRILVLVAPDDVRDHLHVLGAPADRREGLDDLRRRVLLGLPRGLQDQGGEPGRAELDRPVPQLQVREAAVGSDGDRDRAVLAGRRARDGGEVLLRLRALALQLG